MTISADILFPLFGFCIAKAALPNLASHTSLLSDFTDDRDSFGERGYCLTTLLCGLDLLQHMSSTAEGTPSPVPPSLSSTGPNDRPLLSQQSEESAKEQPEPSPTPRDLFQGRVSGKAMAQWIKEILRMAGYGRSEQGWVYLGADLDIKVFSRNTPVASIQCTKGVGIINCRPARLLWLIATPCNRQHYDVMCREVLLVEKVSDTTDILHLKFRVRNRLHIAKYDFCVLQHQHKLKDGTIVILRRSVNHSKCGPYKQYVRALMFTSGWVLRPSLDGKQTEATYMLHIDLGKKAPAWLSQLFASKQPLLVSTVRAFVEGASPTSPSRSVRSPLSSRSSPRSIRSSLPRNRSSPRGRKAKSPMTAAVDRLDAFGVFE